MGVWRAQHDRMAEGGHWMESFFYGDLSQLPPSTEHARLLRFPRSVDPVGQPAHRSRSYSHPVQRVTNTFRAGMRRIAPGWWL